MKPTKPNFHSALRLLDPKGRCHDGYVFHNGFASACPAIKALKPTATVRDTYSSIGQPPNETHRNVADAGAAIKPEKPILLLPLHLLAVYPPAVPEFW